MANDVTQRATAAATQHEPDPYAEYANEVSTRPFDGDLLRFSKHGEYKAGQEQEEVEEGTRMLVYMPGMKRGWVKWQEQQPVEHIMGLVTDGFRPPPRDELGDLDEDEWETLNGKPIDPWQKTNHLPMCDQNGKVYTFVSASKGGLSAVGALSEAYSMRRRMKPNEIPVIELQSRSYQHKEYGETFAPVFKVIGWTEIPRTFSELTHAVDDTSDDTLKLEDVMTEPDEGEDVLGEAPARKPAPRQAQKTAQKTQTKPAQKSTTGKKPPPPSSRNAKAASNGGRRSPRL